MGKSLVLNQSAKGEPYFIELYISSRHCPLQDNLSLPRSVRETQLLHQVGPSGTSTLLLANIPEELLSLVKKNLQVSLVVLILVGSLEVSGEVDDLDGQDSGLHLRGTGISAHTRNLCQLLGSIWLLCTGWLRR